MNTLYSLKLSLYSNWDYKSWTKFKYHLDGDIAYKVLEQPIDAIRFNSEATTARQSYECWCLYT